MLRKVYTSTVVLTTMVKTFKFCPKIIMFLCVLNNVCIARSLKSPIVLNKILNVVTGPLNKISTMLIYFYFLWLIYYLWRLHCQYSDILTSPCSLYCSLILCSEQKLAIWCNCDTKKASNYLPYLRHHNLLLNTNIFKIQTLDFKSKNWILCFNCL